MGQVSSVFEVEGHIQDHLPSHKVKAEYLGWKPNSGETTRRPGELNSVTLLHFSETPESRCLEINHTLT